MNKTPNHIPIWKTPKVITLTTSNTCSKTPNDGESAVPGVAPADGAS